MTQLQDYITGWSAWPRYAPAPLKGYRYQKEGSRPFSIPPHLVVAEGVVLAGLAREEGEEMTTEAEVFAAIEALKAGKLLVEKERDALKAEVERLKDALDKECGQKDAQFCGYAADVAEARKRAEKAEAENKRLREAMERGCVDISPCMDCGEAVACVPDGLPMCKECGEKPMLAKEEPENPPESS